MYTTLRVACSRKFSTRYSRYRVLEDTPWVILLPGVVQEAGSLGRGRERCTLIAFRT